MRRFSRAGRHFHIEQPQDADGVWWVWEVDDAGGIIGRPEESLVGMATREGEARLVARLVVGNATRDTIDRACRYHRRRLQRR